MGKILRSKVLKYSSGYKYQLCDGYFVQTKIFPDQRAACRFVTLTPSGMLYIENGFASDGPSGLTWDTDSSMPAGFTHDALYRLFQCGQLDLKFRSLADQLLYDMGIEDGMFKWRIKTWLRAVKRWGGPHAKTPTKIYTIYSP